MSERVTAEELRRVLDTLEQAAEDHASADRTVASDDIGVAVDALERAADTIAALERDLQRAADNMAAYEKNAIADGRFAMERIAALEREAKPVKFRWEATDNLPYQRLRDGYAGNLRVGKVLSVRYGEWFWELRNQMGWAGVEQSEDEAKAALEDEILKQLRGGE